MKSKKLKKIKFGVIGYGSIGKIHNSILRKLGYETLIFDTTNEKGKIKFSSLEKIVKNCEAIIISSPSFTHFTYLKYFSKKNKHVFIEKPFSHEVNETNKILKNYKKNKNIIAVNYNLRVRESIRALKKSLKKVNHIYWSKFIMSSNVLNWRKKYNFSKNYTHNKLAGGIIFDSIHEIDLNQYLFKDIKFINSSLINYDKKIFKNNSFAHILLKVNNKFISSIQLDYKGSPDKRTIEILTDKGLFLTDIKKNSLKLIDKNNQIKIFKKFHPNKINDYTKMIKNFISRINYSKKEIICGPEEALKNIKIAKLANE
tara:strand:- start:307 stop:1248 length:942 start_codon:yes stop_codon:yes gene_type:complete